MGHLFIVFGATPICRGLWYGARCFSPPYGPDHDRARRSTRAVRNLGEAPDPRRGMCSSRPQCTDSIALSCPSGLRWRRSGPGGSRNSGAGRRASWGFCVAAS